jgi:acyl-CoA dehydrogenase
MCKLFGIDTVRMVTDKALEILGGRGFFKTSDFERIYRDARAGWLEEGTPTILRTVISREVINAGA